MSIPLIFIFCLIMEVDYQLLFLSFIIVAPLLMIYTLELVIKGLKGEPKNKSYDVTDKALTMNRYRAKEFKVERLTISFDDPENKDETSIVHEPAREAISLFLLRNPKDTPTPKNLIYKHNGDVYPHAEGFSLTLKSNGILVAESHGSKKVITLTGVMEKYPLWTPFDEFLEFLQWASKMVVQAVLFYICQKFALEGKNILLYTDQNDFEKIIPIQRKSEQCKS